MGWTVIIEDEDGNPVRTMPGEFVLSDQDIIYTSQFRLLKYLDPYGDTTFNSYMFEDLLTDLDELSRLLPGDKDQIDIVINYVKICGDDVHAYLKFYGD